MMDMNREGGSLFGCTRDDLIIIIIGIEERSMYGAYFSLLGNNDFLRGRIAIFIGWLLAGKILVLPTLRFQMGKTLLILSTYYGTDSTVLSSTRRRVKLHEQGSLHSATSSFSLFAGDRPSRQG